MPRIAALAFVLSTLCAGSPVRAASYLYLAGEPGDGMLDGGQVLLTTVAGATVEPQLRWFPPGVLITAANQDAGWSVLMEVPPESALTPGTYPDALGALVGTGTYPADSSHLSLSGSRGCVGGGYGTVESTGRFVLRHVLVVGISLIELVADFELRCTGAAGAIRGTVVFEGGSVSCFNQPAGTACDDRDPCTQGDVCQGGICAGVDAVSPTCTAPDSCHDAGVCDRQLARCIAPSRADGAACDDGSSCTTDDRCQDGRCAGGPAVDCDDGSICTTDRCDPEGGCRHEAAPGSCWVARPVARSVATASGPGGSARCSLRCQSPEPVTLLLSPDATYRVQGGGTAVCPSGEPVDFPDEIGTTRRGRRGRLLLEPSNREEIAAASRRCGGTPLRRTSYRRWIKPGGDHLVGRSTTRGRGSVRGVAVSFVADEQFTAVPALDANGMLVDPPPTDPRAPICRADLRPRCTRD